MLRAFSIRVFLFFFIMASYCHAQPTATSATIPEIATIYIFDSQTTTSSASDLEKSISDQLTSFQIKQSAYFSYGASSTMEQTRCHFPVQDINIINTHQDYYDSNRINLLINKIKPIIQDQCQNLSSIPLWNIIIVRSHGTLTSSLCQHENQVPCSSTKNYTGGISAFLKQIAKACSFGDLVGSSTTRNRILSIKTKSGSPIFEIRKPAATCKSCTTKSQSCENLSLAVGSYELSAGWFNRIQQENVKGSDGSTLNISQKFNRISFTLPIGPANNSISISRITPHHRHRAGVGVLTSVLFFAALTGAGFLSTDIYNPCLSSPESLPTYRCIGTSGSQLTKQVMTGVGISGMLVGLSIGIPLVVVK